MSLTELPDEIILKVVGYLGYNDAMNVCGMPEFEFVCGDEIFWKKKAEKEFGVQSNEFNKLVRGDERSSRWEPMEPSEVYLRYASLNGEAYYESVKYINLYTVIYGAAKAGKRKLIHQFKKDYHKQRNFEVMREISRFEAEGLAEVNKLTTGIDELSLTEIEGAVRGYAKDYAANRDKIEQLIAAAANFKLPFETEPNLRQIVLESTSAFGNLEAAIEYVNRDVSLTQKAVENASKYGHLHLITWFDQNEQLDPILFDSIVFTTSRYGHLNIIKYLFENNHEPTGDDIDYSIDGAAQGNHLDIIFYWYTRDGSIIWLQGAVYEMAKAPSLTGYVPSSQIYSPELQVKGRHYDTIQYLFENYDLSGNDDDYFDENLYMEGAIEGGDPEIVQYFLDRKTYTPNRIVTFISRSVWSHDDKMGVYFINMLADNFLASLTGTGFRANETYGQYIIIVSSGVGCPLSVACTFERIEPFTPDLASVAQHALVELTRSTQNIRPKIPDEDIIETAEYLISRGAVPTQELLDKSYTLPPLTLLFLQNGVPIDIFISGKAAKHKADKSSKYASVWEQIYEFV